LSTSQIDRIVSPTRFLKVAAEPTRDFEVGLVSTINTTRAVGTLTVSIALGHVRRRA